MSFTVATLVLPESSRLGIAYGLIAIAIIGACAVLIRFRRHLVWYRDLSTYFHGRRLREVKRKTGRREVTRWLYLSEIGPNDRPTGSYHHTSLRWCKKHGAALRNRVSESAWIPPAPEPAAALQQADPIEEREEEAVPRLSAVG
jgi:hypothetical protein